MGGFHVSQIDHVELFVPDRHEAAHWYARTLGLRIVPEYEHWAQNPHGPLMIGTPDAGTKLALFTGEPRRDRPMAGFHLVAFRVSRAVFDAFRVHVRDNPVFDEDGKEVREVAVRDHGQARSVYFCDPWGHRLEITTYEV
jgi:catechol 2,3-dioxygenase-like lactoylglutathione lyase family enzyme